MEAESGAREAGPSSLADGVDVESGGRGIQGYAQILGAVSWT